MVLEWVIALTGGGTAGGVAVTAGVPLWTAVAVGVSTAAFVAAAKVFVDHHVLRKEFDNRRTEVDRRFDAVEREVQAIPQVIERMTESLSEGFHELKEAFEENATRQQQELKEHGETLAYLKGAEAQRQQQQRSSTT